MEFLNHKGISSSKVPEELDHTDPAPPEQTKEPLGMNALDALELHFNSGSDRRLNNE